LEQHRYKAVDVNFLSCAKMKSEVFQLSKLRKDETIFLNEIGAQNGCDSFGRKFFAAIRFSLFHVSQIHVILVLAEAVAPMKLFINLDRYRQSTPEYRHDCSWATSALFQ
jgi:hypothetical protein